MKIPRDLSSSDLGTAIIVCSHFSLQSGIFWQKDGVSLFGN